MASSIKQFIVWLSQCLSSIFKSIMDRFTTKSGEYKRFPQKDTSYRYRTQKKVLKIEPPTAYNQERLCFREKSPKETALTLESAAFLSSIEISINEENFSDLISKFENHSDQISQVSQQKINNIFESIHDRELVEVSFELSKILISNECGNFSKYLLKSFFYLCGKCRRGDLAQEMVKFIDENKEKIKVEKPSESMNFISRQYLIFCLVKCEKRTEAYNEYKTLIDILKTEKISRIVLKSAEFLFKEAVKSKNFPRAKAIISDFHDREMEISEIYFNKLIDFCSKNNSLELCEFVLIEMNKLKILPSLVTYNTILDSYIRSNMIDQAWMLFEELKKTENSPDRFTFTTMINCIKKSENIDLDRAFKLLEEYKKTSTPDRVIYNCLLDVCVSANNFEKAEKVLEEMKAMGSIFRLDDISFNILIKASCRAKNLKKAVSFFDDMKAQGISPTIITYNSLLDTFVKAGKMDVVWQLYDAMTTDSIKADPYTYSILINGIKNTSNKREITKIDHLYENLIQQSDFKNDHVIYNSIIDAYLGFEDFDRAFKVFKDMKDNGIKPTTITLNILIKGYGLSGNLEMAFSIFEEMEKHGIKKNEITYGCLIEACVKNHEIPKAFTILSEMKAKGFSENSIQITSIIKGLSRIGKHTEAIELANSMINESLASKKPLNLISYNCLIDVFIRGGEFELGHKLFRLMQKSHTPDLITYSTLIKGALLQKNYKLSTELFDQMLNHNIKPDDVLFNMILDFCVNNKLHEQGLKLFNNLIANNLRPSERTFGLVLKIYGHLKLFQDAYNVLDLMKRLKVRPSLITYTSLLQISINEKKGEMIDKIFMHILNDKLKLDTVCFNKLILGSLRCGQMDLAIKYFLYSRELKINPDSECVRKFKDALNKSSNANKNKVLYVMESGKVGGNVHHSDSQKENRNMNIQAPNFPFPHNKEKITRREVRPFNPL